MSDVQDPKPICNYHDATSEGIAEAFKKVVEKKEKLKKDGEGVIFLTDECTAIEFEVQSKQKLGERTVSIFELSESIVIKSKDEINNLTTYLSQSQNKDSNRTLVLAFSNGSDLKPELQKDLNDMKCELQKNLNGSKWKYAILDLKNFTNKVKLGKTYHEVMQKELCKALKVNEIRESIGEVSDKKLHSLIYKMVLTPLDPVSTGFTKLDEALGCGGLMRGRLYAIGAMSSLGKTTFALNIADNVASSGRDVLIFSLEMSEKELVAKSISRIMRKLDETEKETLSKTAIEIYELAKNVDKWGDDTKKLFNNAVNKYGSLKYPYIIEGIGDIGVEKIREKLDDFQMIGCLPSVVIIDYLQILHPYNERFNDKQNIDRNITELKRISRDFNIAVIVISSFNRGNYLTEVSFESFKESGSIGYSCDVLIGLQLKVQNEVYEIEDLREKKNKREEINKAKIEDPREIQLVILKNRMYKAWSKIDFKYHTRFDWFEELPNSNNFKENEEEKNKQNNPKSKFGREANKFYEGQSGIGEIS